MFQQVAAVVQGLEWEVRRRAVRHDHDRRTFGALVHLCVDDRVVVHAPVTHCEKIAGCAFSSQTAI